MRKIDKLNNIKKANLLVEQLYLAAKTETILSEDFKHILTESEIPGIDKIKKGVEQAGGNLNDKDTQLALLDKFIDADFDLSKVNPQAVIQATPQQEKITEGAEGASELLHLIHKAHSLFDNSEDGARILDLVHKRVNSRITKEQIKKGLEVLEKILNFIPNQFAKAIYKMLKSGGISLEVAKIGSVTGPIIWIALLAGFSVLMFPSISALITSVAGIITLLYKLWNIISTIWSGYKKIVAAKEEQSDTVITAVDYLDELEKIKKIKIDYDEITEADEWYNDLSQDKKVSVNKIFKQAIEYLKDGKPYEGHLELLKRFGYPLDK